MVKKTLLRKLWIVMLAVLPPAMTAEINVSAAETECVPDEPAPAPAKEEEEAELPEEQPPAPAKEGEEAELPEEPAPAPPEEGEDTELPEEPVISEEEVEMTQYAALNETETDIPAEKARMIDCIHFISLDDDYAASDSILIESNGHFGLIDASHPSWDPDPEISGYTVDVDDVIDYLHEVGVMHLDFVLGTHSHSDHIGGMKFLASAVSAAGNFWIDSDTVYYYKQYYYNETEEGEWEWQNSRMFEQSLNAMADTGAILVETSSHDEEALQKANAVFVEGGGDPVSDCIEFTLGNLAVSLFNLYHNSFDNENLNSIVAAVTKDDRTTLLMGDLEIEDGYERRVADTVAEKYGNADVIKLGHHGYEESTSSDMLKTLDPSYVVTTSNRTGNFYEDEPPYNYFLSNRGIVAYRAAEAYMALVEELTGDGIRFYTYDWNGELTEEPDEWNARMPSGWKKWNRDDDTYDYIYIRADGTAATGWNQLTRNGKTSWYLFDEDGLSLRGLQKIGQNTYYLNKKGELQTSQWVESRGQWYRADSYGRIISGWVQSDGKWYYTDSERDGALATNRFITDENGRHYVDGFGILQVNKIFQFNGKPYAANVYGTVQNSGWCQIAGNWCYAGANGILKTGVQLIEGTRYLLDTVTGAMKINEWHQAGGRWYLSDGYGRVLTGWCQSGKNWYYLDPESNGALLTGKLIEDEGTLFYVNSYGILVTNQRIYYNGTYYRANSFGVLTRE